MKFTLKFDRKEEFSPSGSVNQKISNKKKKLGVKEGEKKEEEKGKDDKIRQWKHVQKKYFSFEKLN